MSDPRFDRLHYTSREFRDHNDALAAHTSFTRYITKWYETQRHAWVEDRWLKYGAEAAAPSLIAYTHMIEDVLRADTVWMTTEMMDLTQRAMEGFHHEQAASRDLARQVVGAPRPPRGGTCLWCGAPAPGDIACAGHTDLPYLDPVFAEVVTENTTAASSQSSGRARELAAEGV